MTDFVMVKKKDGKFSRTIHCIYSIQADVQHGLKQERGITIDIKRLIKQHLNGLQSDHGGSVAQACR